MTGDVPFSRTENGATPILAVGYDATKHSVHTTALFVVGFPEEDEQALAFAGSGDQSQSGSVPLRARLMIAVTHPTPA